MGNFDEELDKVQKEIARFQLNQLEDGVELRHTYEAATKHLIRIVAAKNIQIEDYRKEEKLREIKKRKTK